SGGRAATSTRPATRGRKTPPFFMSLLLSACPATASVRGLAAPARPRPDLAQEQVAAQQDAEGQDEGQPRLAEPADRGGRQQAAIDVGPVQLLSCSHTNPSSRSSGGCPVCWGCATGWLGR